SSHEYAVKCMSPSPERIGKQEFSFFLNGEAVRVRALSMERLLDVLRMELGLTGAKEGCGEGECGSCSVLINGELVNSCLVPLAQVSGACVAESEGLARDQILQLLEEAFLEQGGTDCGTCAPRMIVAEVDVVGHQQKAALEQIKESLSENLYRAH